MRKTLQDVAGYLQTILVPEAQGAYAIKPGLAPVAPEEKMREGITAFRAFLHRLYGVLAVEGGAYDKHTKVAHEYENRITLSVYYPFLHHVKNLLMHIGFRGTLSQDGRALLCGNDIFDEKLSVAKTLECLRFLAACGLRLDGLDLQNKKQSLSDIQSITVACPDDPAMLTGLKVMAMAEIELGTLDNQDIFLRCDYRVLKRDAPDALSILRDTVTPLSAVVQDFLLRLHRRYTDMGLACAVEIKGFWVYIKYAFRRKDVWGMNASLNNGYHLNIKPLKTDQYADAIEAFPPFLRDLIAKGYGCGRKRAAIGHCDGGCHGLLIPLDDSVLALRDDIVTWLDLELSCLQKK